MVQSIVKIKNGWKKADHKEKCSHCSSNVNRKSDYFELKAYWKIKGKADNKIFCSLKCLNNWTQE